MCSSTRTVAGKASSFTMTSDVLNGFHVAFSLVLSIIPCMLRPSILASVSPSSAIPSRSRLGWVICSVTLRPLCNLIFLPAWRSGVCLGLDLFTSVLQNFSAILFGDFFVMFLGNLTKTSSDIGFIMTDCTTALTWRYSYSRISAALSSSIHSTSWIIHSRSIASIHALRFRSVSLISSVFNIDLTVLLPSSSVCL